MPAQTEAIIVKFKTVAANTTELQLSVPETFKFIAGQYVSLTIPTLAHLPGTEGFHDFSISSSPNEVGTIKITFRNSGSLFKKTLLAMKPGEKLRIDGPQGVFTFSTDGLKLCVAGGIGITPFKSAVSGGMKDIELLYYNNSLETSAYLDELHEQLGTKLLVAYSKPQLSDLEGLNRHKPGADWYVAGPPGMVAEVRALLKTLKIDDTLIRTEEFSGYDRHH